MLPKVKFFELQDGAKVLLHSLQGRVDLLYLDRDYLLPLYSLPFSSTQDAEQHLVPDCPRTISQGHFLLGIERQNSSTAFLVGSGKELQPGIFGVIDLDVVSFPTKQPHRACSTFTNILLTQPHSTFVLGQNLFPCEFELNGQLVQPLRQFGIPYLSMYQGSVSDTIRAKFMHGDLFIERALNGDGSLAEISTNMDLGVEPMLITAPDQVVLPTSSSFKLFQKLSTQYKLGYGVATNNPKVAKQAGFHVDATSSLRIMFKQTSLLSECQLEQRYLEMANDVPLLITEIPAYHQKFSHFTRRVFMTLKLAKLTKLHVRCQSKIGKVNIYGGIQPSQLRLIFSGNLSSSYIDEFTIPLDEVLLNFLIVDAFGSEFSVSGLGEYSDIRFGFSSATERVIEAQDIDQTTQIHPQKKQTTCSIMTNSFLTYDLESCFYTSQLGFFTPAREVFGSEVLSTHAVKQLENVITDDEVVRGYGFAIVSGGASVLDNLLSGEGLAVDTDTILEFEVGSVYSTFRVRVVSGNQVWIDGEECYSSVVTQGVFMVKIRPTLGKITVDRMEFSEMVLIPPRFIKHKATTPNLKPIPSQQLDKDGKRLVKLKHFSIVSIFDFKVASQGEVVLEFLNSPSEGFKLFNLKENGPTANEQFSVQQVHSVTALTSGLYEIVPPVRCQRLNVTGAVHVQVYGCEEK